MASIEERLRILKMVEQGQITAEDGARLLEALSSSEQRKGESSARSPTAPPRWFRVRVTDTRSGKDRVNVNIPMNLVSVGLKMGARFAPEMEGLDLNELNEMIRSGATGKLLEVEDTDEGERVQIFVE